MVVTPRQLAAAAAAMLVVLASMATRPSASAALPGPPSIGAAAASVAATPAAKPKIYAPSGPEKVGACVIEVSDPAPKIGASSETVTVRTTAGAWVSLSASYASYTSGYGVQADPDGIARFALANPNATPGRTVKLAARATLQGSQTGCSGSFTPEALSCQVRTLGQTMTAGRIAETVAVSSSLGAQVRLQKLSGTGVWDYSKSSPTGEVTIAVPITSTEMGTSVRIQVQVAMLGAQAECATSFVPASSG
ncbi:MAG: hypothetical protein M0000_02900 [Actinomycetota bacterium]|nr:hypothetical protein [Actinomycetota bacterium]